MKTQLYNLQGKEVGQVELPDDVFGRKWNADLVYQAVVSQAANRRNPIAHTKGRGEVSGGGKKPWKQKGTGRARHGSIRSPLWKGGGVSHGPTKNEIFAKKVNKKMAKGALYSALSKKLSDGEVKIIDSLKISAPKTKILVQALKNFSLNALLIPDVSNKELSRAARNIPKVGTFRPDSLNAEAVLRYKNVLIDKEAVAQIK